MSKKCAFSRAELPPQLRAHFFSYKRFLAMNPASTSTRPTPSSAQASGGAPPLTSAERTALSVFHDLELAHAREERESPRRAARLQVSARKNLLEAEEDLLSRFQGSTSAPDGTSAVAEPASDSSR